jgi:hypothetical protein
MWVGHHRVIWHFSAASTRTTLQHWALKNLTKKKNYWSFRSLEQVRALWSVEAQRLQRRCGWWIASGRWSASDTWLPFWAAVGPVLARFWSISRSITGFTWMNVGLRLLFRALASCKAFSVFQCLVPWCCERDEQNSQSCRQLHGLALGNYPDADEFSL